LFGIGPISQQAVSSVVCSSPANGQQATITVAFKMPNREGDMYSATLESLVDIPLMGGIVNSLANPNQNQTGLVSGCSTGNCTFPMINGITHSTIGMCSQCIDITSELQVNTSGASNIGTLPNGLFLWYLDALNATGGSDSSGSSELDSILSQVEDHGFAAIMSASIFNWTIIARSRSNMTRPVISTACSIYPCMRHYAGLMDRGEFNETLVSTVLALPFGPYFGPYAGINASCVIDGSAYDLTRILPNQIGIVQNRSVFLTLDKGNLTLPSQCINEIDSYYVIDLHSFLSIILTGDCSMFSPRCEEQWWLGALWNSGNATFDTVQSTFNSIAESITNRMRIQGYDPRTNGTALVYGTVIETTTCITFFRKWILFPTLLIILTIVCLAITMAQPIYGVETPSWKSSILPLLYASPRTQLVASGEACDMMAKSKITVARLEKRENEWSFVDKSNERG
jgi:hypothetical protein